MCFTADSPAFELTSRQYLRFLLNVLTGAEAIDFHDMAKQARMSEAEVEVHRLIQVVNDINHEMVYQEEVESSFQRARSSARRQIVLLAVVQAVVLVVTATLQRHHLMGFFVKSKIM
mmetsp:Transcript_20941/g.35942  ORF Transcript_20941/g.35942 Transcript_20941/m.35942 type:complete len:117 (+) Transcript_20941:327-677(+)